MFRCILDLIQTSTFGLAGHPFCQGEMVHFYSSLELLSFWGFGIRWLAATSLNNPKLTMPEQVRFDLNDFKELISSHPKCLCLR